MIVAVFLAANTVGAIPLLISIGIKTASNPELLSEMASNPNDLSLISTNPISGLVVMLVPFLAGLAAFWLLVKPLNGRSFTNTVNGTGSIRWKRIFLSAFIWIIISGLYLLIYMKYDPSNFKINNSTSSLLVLASVSLILIPFQTTLEEIIFRGYLMQGFAVIARNRLTPILLTSLLFGLLHAWNPEVKEYGFFVMMPQYIVFGLLFAILTVIDDGIEIAIEAHTANNVFLSILVTNSSSALQTPALFEQQKIYPWVEFWSLLTAAIIFFSVMMIIFRWHSLKVLWGRVGSDEISQVL